MTTRADDLALAPAHSAIATFVADTRRLERVPVHGWSLLGAALGRLAPPHLLAAAHALLKTRVDEELVPTYIKAEAARQGLKTVRGKAYAVTATRASPARASAATVHIADSPPLARTGNGRERHAAAPVAVRIAHARGGADGGVSVTPTPADVVAAFQTALSVAQDAPSHLTLDVVDAVVGLKAALEKLEVGGHAVRRGPRAVWFARVEDACDGYREVMPPVGTSEVTGTDATPLSSLNSDTVAEVAAGGDGSTHGGVASSAIASLHAADSRSRVVVPRTPAAAATRLRDRRGWDRALRHNRTPSRRRAGVD